MRLFILSFFIFLIQACSFPTKIVKYAEQKNERYTNDSVVALLKANKNPRVVLRINSFITKPTLVSAGNSSTNYLYSVMEKELVKQGFRVKDRSTFNDIISKTYSSELLKQELSDADLILEVVNLDDHVIYATNTVTSIGGKKVAEKVYPFSFKSLGASVEYRLILVKNNEIGGTYKFFYQPCLHGCPVKQFKFHGKGKNKEVQLAKSLPQETMQEFISNSIKELIHSIT